VREAAKAGDHIPVPAGEVGRTGIAEPLEQRQRRLLHRQVFRVHQRHQPELAPRLLGLRFLTPGVELTAERPPRHRPRNPSPQQGIKGRVLGEPLARPALHEPERSSCRAAGMSVFSLLVIVHALAATVWTGGHLVLDLGVLPRALRGAERGPDPSLRRGL
jgi:hypothetical protein